MKCKILHESKGRLRIHIPQGRMTLEQADILEAYLLQLSCVTDAKVYDRTCDAVIFYHGQRDAVLTALATFRYQRAQALAPEHSGRALNREYQDKLFFTLCRRVVNRTIMPLPIRTALTLCRSVRYLWAGLRCLRKGHIQVPVLDATAITVSLLRRDFKTAGSIMFLLSIGETLDEWTHKKSVADLARTMSLNVDHVWLDTEGGSVQVSLSEVEAGDRIIVRTGSMIPLDGKVVAGEAMVNQASITGEPLAVRKTIGGYVYAGTVVEEGDCTICVEKTAGSGRYDRIVHMIEESEKLKSTLEGKAASLADALVPLSFGGTILTWLLTRNVTKAISVLMVDFSCALKLAMPLSVLSAMREASSHQVTVKGGVYLEAAAEADTIVFDKTGTLTKARPVVAGVVTFEKREENEMLRIAACLEEHFPHSMANAVVNESVRRGLVHEEMHSKVDYIVAHGIASYIGEDRVIIGSSHFVFEDEKCVVPEGEEEKFESLPPEYSHLYLAVAGRLAAVICIEDPLREEAPEVMRKLKGLGISKIVMMTGDSERTARAIAARVGVDEYYSEVLPEDKAAFVEKEKKAGRKVIMVGDGINDSPALSAADVGIAISEGAEIAREIADITISENALTQLVTLKALSNALMRRVNWNYRFVIGFNFGLILLGVGGILAPAPSALLHNTSTLLVSMKSMTNLLEKEEGQKARG